MVKRVEKNKRDSKYSGNKTYWIIAIVIIIILAVFALGIFLNKNTRVSGNAVLTGMSAGTAESIPAKNCIGVTQSGKNGAYYDTITNLDGDKEERYYQCLLSCVEGRDKEPNRYQKIPTYKGQWFKNDPKLYDRIYNCELFNDVCCVAPENPDDPNCAPKDYPKKMDKSYKCVKKGTLSTNGYCTNELKGSAIGTCSDPTPVCCEYPK